MLLGAVHISVLVLSCVLALGVCVGWLVCHGVLARAEGVLGEQEYGAGRRPLTLSLSALLCAAAMGALAATQGLTVETLQLACFVPLLLHLSLTDIDRRRIPNVDLVLALGVRLAYLLFGLLTYELYPADVRFYLFSAAVVFALLLATILVADWLLGAESMGGGDLKLLTVCALYLGWFNTLIMLFVACVFGVLTAVPALLRRSDSDAGTLTFPFGPSIALATVLGLILLP